MAMEDRNVLGAIPLKDEIVLVAVQDNSAKDMEEVVVEIGVENVRAQMAREQMVDEVAREEVDIQAEEWRRTRELEEDMKLDRVGELRRLSDVDEYVLVLESSKTRYSSIDVAV